MELETKLGEAEKELEAGRFLRTHPFFLKYLTFSFTHLLTQPSLLM